MSLEISLLFQFVMGGNQMRWRKGSLEVSPGNSSSQNGDVFPKDNDLKTYVNQVSKIRAKAKAADKVWDERYIKRRTKNNPLSLYSVGETDCGLLQSVALWLKVESSREIGK